MQRSDRGDLGGERPVRRVDVRLEPVPQRHRLRGAAAAGRSAGDSCGGRGAPRARWRRSTSAPADRGSASSASTGPTATICSAVDEHRAGVERDARRRSWAARCRHGSEWSSGHAAGRSTICQPTRGLVHGGVTRSPMPGSLPPMDGQPRGSTTTHVGMIGLGIIGSAVAEQLLASGHTPVVHDLRPEPLARAQELGATVATSAQRGGGALRHGAGLCTERRAVSRGRRRARRHPRRGPAREHDRDPVDHPSRHDHPAGRGRRGARRRVGRRPDGGAGGSERRATARCG